LATNLTREQAQEMEQELQRKLWKDQTDLRFLKYDATARRHSRSTGGRVHGRPGLFGLHGVEMIAINHGLSKIASLRSQ
jgi:hypothetical protein